MSKLSAFLAVIPKIFFQPLIDLEAKKAAWTNTMVFAGNFNRDQVNELFEALLEEACEDAQASLESSIILFDRKLALAKDAMFNGAAIETMFPPKRVRE